MTQPQTAAAPDILCAEQVAELHARFLARLDRDASEQAERLKLDPESAQALRDLLLAAHRQREKIDPDVLAELCQQGADAINAMAQYMHHVTPFDPAQQDKLDFAAARREEPPAVAAAFGAQKRLYMPLADTGASLTEQRVGEHLARHGYTVTDYKKGYATDAAGKQTFKIGKLLQQHVPFMYQRFVEDASRVNDRLLVVISRAPDDIARMSANRGWKSCMAPEKNEFDAFVPRDILHGTLVAYLVSDKDPGIHNPLARILLKPYQSERQVIYNTPERPRRPGMLRRLFGALAKRPQAAAPPAPADTGPKTIYVPEGKAYGLNCDALRATVERFAAAHLNAAAPDGGYHLSPLLYCDSNSSREVVKQGDALRVLKTYPDLNAALP